jgi:hypothetical protein
VWGSSWRKESLPPIFALLKIPQSGPILRKQQFTKRNCCGFPARKHPTPPGTGTEPGASSGLGAAPAPGTRQFSKALLAVGPPVITDPREMTTQTKLSKFLFQQRTLHHKLRCHSHAHPQRSPTPWRPPVSASPSLALLRPSVCTSSPSVLSVHPSSPSVLSVRPLRPSSPSVIGSGCAPGAPMVRTIKHTKFSGCRCIRYAARSTGRGLNNIFRNWRVGMSPHMPPGAQRLSNQEGPKSVTVSRFLSAFFYVKSPVRFSF